MESEENDSRTVLFGAIDENIVRMRDQIKLVLGKQRSKVFVVLFVCRPFHGSIQFLVVWCSHRFCCIGGLQFSTNFFQETSIGKTEHPSFIVRTGIAEACTMRGGEVVIIRGVQNA